MPVIYEPPLANPAPGGLYAAAAVLDRRDPSRIADGIVVESMNCGPSWVLPIDCTNAEDAPDPVPKWESRADNLTFDDGVVVGAHDDCSALVPEQEAQQRGEQLLRLHEQVRVEHHLTPLLLSAAGTPTDVAGVVAAVGALEEAVADFGFTGVFHAAPHLAAAMYSAQLVIRQGTQLLTPAGHRWAFGAGYAGLGETIVSTGPVVVHRSPPVPTHGPDYPHNERLSVTQREVLVTWECWADAVTIGE